MSSLADSLPYLEHQRVIESCTLCPRLVRHREAVAAKQTMPRKLYAHQSYWGKPVPDFVDTKSSQISLLVIGLAPGAHGGNRTGRMFTGDDSGRWLYRALHRFGFAETPHFESLEDNRLIQTAITCVAHCVPPENKPNPEELGHCAIHLKTSLELYRPRVIVCLGAVAWAQTRKLCGLSVPKFQHGFREAGVNPELWIASYHPSRQNTQTRVLTEPMFDSIFAAAAAHLKLTET